MSGSIVMVSVHRVSGCSVHMCWCGIKAGVLHVMGVLHVVGGSVVGVLCTYVGVHD